MPDDYPAVSVDHDYVSALGAAVYAWATLEWNAVRCCERIRPGSIEALSDRTAGRVADTLVALAGDLPASKEQNDLSEAAVRFAALVRTRNNLFHAKPGTNAEGRERLFRSGDEWLLAEIMKAAETFEDCARRLDFFLGGFLVDALP